MNVESIQPIAMPRQPDPKIRRMIMVALRDHADFSGGAWGPDTAQLAVWLDRPYMTVKKYVDRMIEARTVEMIGAKRWLRLTTAGRRELTMMPTEH